MTSEPETKVWCGNTFRFVCALEPQVDVAGDVQTFMPQAQYAKAATSRLNPHGAGPFCRFSIPKSIDEEGVYAITSAEKTVYVGLCNNLSSRFNMGYGNISPKNCYIGGQSTNCKINAKVLNDTLAGNTLQLWFLPTADKVHVERQLIQQLQPPWNGRQS